MANECISFYDPGKNLNGLAAGAITGCRFLMISADRHAADATAGANLITVNTATAAGRICGVSQSDAASGTPVGVVRGSGRVVPVQAGGATIAAFAEVEVGAAGVAVTKASGVAVGYAVTGCAANGVAQVNLY